MTGYHFACRKLGMDCAFEIHGAVSPEEILQEAGTHAKVAHQIATVSPDLAAKVRSAISG